jgi:hypothetical protein
MATFSIFLFSIYSPSQEMALPGTLKLVVKECQGIAPAADFPSGDDTTTAHGFLNSGVGDGADIAAPAFSAFPPGAPNSILFGEKIAMHRFALEVNTPMPPAFKTLLNTNFKGHNTYLHLRLDNKVGPLPEPLLPPSPKPPGNPTISNDHAAAGAAAAHSQWELDHARWELECLVLQIHHMFSLHPTAENAWRCCVYTYSLGYIPAYISKPNPGGEEDDVEHWKTLTSDDLTEPLPVFKKNLVKTHREKPVKERVDLSGVGEFSLPLIRSVRSSTIEGYKRPTRGSIWQSNRPQKAAKTHTGCVFSNCAANQIAYPTLSVSTTLVNFQHIL